LQGFWLFNKGVDIFKQLLNVFVLLIGQHSYACGGSGEIRGLAVPDFFEFNLFVKSTYLLFRLVIVGQGVAENILSFLGKGG